MAGQVELAEAEREVLDFLARRELERGEPTPLLEVLRRRPHADKDTLCHAVETLRDLKLVNVGPLDTFDSHLPIPLARRGVLTSSWAGDWEKVGQRLIRYLRERVEAEGSDFKQYDWQQIKAAGVASEDAEFRAFVRVVQLFGLARGSSLGASNGGQTGTWHAPAFAAELRGLEALTDVDAFLTRAERAQLESLAFRGPEPETGDARQRARRAPDPRGVFLIHGRNLRARKEMAIFLRACGLEPILFDELRAEMGAAPTIAEVVEQGMHRAQGVVALFTPDEYAALRSEYRDARDAGDALRRWQARPNVIFEAGMAFGRDRRRVVFVLLGEPRLFTDVDGISVLYPTNDPKGDRGILRDTLGKGTRCTVKDSREWMDAGDFEACVDATPPLVDPFEPGTAEATPSPSVARELAYPAMPGSESGWFEVVVGSAEHPGRLSDAARLEAVVPGRNPYVFGPALPASSPVFVGRERVLRDVEDALTGRERPLSVSVLGERRSGKSSLLNQLFASLEATPGVVVARASAQSFQAATPAAIFGELYRAIAGALGVPPPGNGDDYTRLRQLLRRHAESHRYVLLLDEFDELTQSPNLQREFYSNLRALGDRAELRCAFVLASRSSLADLAEQSHDVKASQFWNIFQPAHCLGLLAPREVERLRDAVFRRGSALKPPDAPALLRLTGAYPAFLQLGLDLTWTAAHDRRPFRDVELELVHALGDHFRSLWRHRSRRERELLVELASGAPGAASDEPRFEQAELVRRGVLSPDGSLFSEAFSAWVRSARTE